MVSRSFPSSRRWNLSRCTSRWGPTLARRCDPQPPPPTEEQLIHSQGAPAVAGPRQRSNTMRRESWWGRSTPDRFGPLWGGVAGLRASLQRLPAAVRRSSEKRIEPVSGRHGRTDPELSVRNKQTDVKL